MKKFIVIAAALLAGFSSCYKEKKPAQAYDVLTRHKWKIESHVNASVDTGADCRVPSEVEFNKDSTGYFYYYTTCSPTDSAKKTFRWYISKDNANIYYSYLEGVAGTHTVGGVSYFDNSVLRLRSLMYKDHFWDGYFVAYEDKE